MEYRIKEYKTKKYTQYCLQVLKDGVWITLCAATDKNIVVKKLQQVS